MYCINCGNEINDNDKFCRFCGKPTDLQDSNDSEKRSEDLLTKVFNFNHKSNKKSLSIINTWLNDNIIIIKNISLSTYLKQGLSLWYETVINRFEINYIEEKERGHIYNLDYFDSKAWIGGSFNKVDKCLEQWKHNNPGKSVVWEHRCGHQFNGGSNRNLYFLYV